MASLFVFSWSITCFFEKFLRITDNDTEIALSPSFDFTGFIEYINFHQQLLSCLRGLLAAKWMNLKRRAIKGVFF
jgi:hypothetical protein